MMLLDANGIELISFSCAYWFEPIVAFTPCRHEWHLEEGRIANDHEERTQGVDLKEGGVFGFRISVVNRDGGGNVVFEVHNDACSDDGNECKGNWVLQINMPVDEVARDESGENDGELLNVS